MRHLRVQLRADTERVLDQHLAQVLDAALEVVEPARRPLQPVGRADVEHEEPVEIPDEGLFVEIRGEELRVLGLHSPVATEVEVVALLGGDDAEVLALRLGALARAARDRGLQLVRRAQALVAVLQADGHARRSGTTCYPRTTSRCAAPCRRHGPTRSQRRSARARSRAAARGVRRTGPRAGRR